MCTVSRLIADLGGGSKVNVSFFLFPKELKQKYKSAISQTFVTSVNPLSNYSLNISFQLLKRTDGLFENKKGRKGRSKEK